jgi:hypothetical protein
MEPSLANRTSAGYGCEIGAPAAYLVAGFFFRLVTYLCLLPVKSIDQLFVQAAGSVRTRDADRFAAKFPLVAIFSQWVSLPHKSWITPFRLVGFCNQVSEKFGSPGRIRTSDQPVNSRLLYR